MSVVSQRLLLTAVAAGLVGCQSHEPGPNLADPRVWRRAPALPEPLANNAVAAVANGDSCTLYTAMGIGDPLAYDGIVNHAYQWHVGTPNWLPLPDVPSAVGRVASTAVAVREKVYVIGGYSVDEEDAEVSFGAVHVYDLASGRWTTTTPLPVRVDDHVSLAWADRWIVTVSGWSNTAPVDAVQIFDVEDETWAAGTPFPGTPVFGHAAAIFGDQLLVTDGVAVRLGGFELVNQAWLGTLDPEDPTNIAWQDLGPHPGPARYRAAAGHVWGSEVWFHGGTDDPYNYNGLSYESGEPSQPLTTTMLFDFETATFAEHAKAKPIATMDHRGLVTCGGRQYTVGGMVAGPEATTDVWVYTY